MYSFWYVKIIVLLTFEFFDLLYFYNSVRCFHLTSPRDCFPRYKCDISGEILLVLPEFSSAQSYFFFS